MVQKTIELPQIIADTLEYFPFIGIYLRWWFQLLVENPIHLFIETVLIIFLLYIVLLKRPGKKKSKLDSLPPHVIQELIDDFKPEPLCPEISKGSEMILKDIVVLEQKPAKVTKIQGLEKDIINFATMDFCGLAQRKEITKAGNDALDKYGCGSCGPRGFYGTIDVHIYLEQDIAKFYGAEDAIVYSDANSTPSSAIPAFSNRADILIVDDGVNDAILTGVNLSRSRTLFFKHNDMDDLKRLLIKIDNEDKKMKRSPQRRFVVVEGLYRNYGDIAPLDEIYKLKKEYKWRMFVDESHSVGTMGVTGRGVHEHFGLTINDIDICVASLSTTLASVGGFCVGTREVVEHQRLNGAGYTFSASSPPFVSTVGSASLKILTEESNLVSTLKKKAQFFHNQIAQIGKGFLVTTSNQASPLVHIRLDSQHTFAKNREEYNQDSEKRVEEEAILRNMSKILREEAGFYAPVANYVFNPLSGKTIGGSTKPTLPPPSIRVAITVNHEESELTALCIALCDTAKKCLSKN